MCAIMCSGKKKRDRDSLDSSLNGSLNGSSLNGSFDKKMLLMPTGDTKKKSLCQVTQKKQSLCQVSSKQHDATKIRSNHLTKPIGGSHIHTHIFLCVCVVVCVTCVCVCNMCVCVCVYPCLLDRLRS